MKKYFIILIDVLLFYIFYKVFSHLKTFYPLPQLTWDSSYYIDTSLTLEYGIRPSGYSYFLYYLYQYSKDIQTVVWVQFLLFFVAVISFLKTITHVFKLPIWLYPVLGIFFLLEPVSLYHANSILSDSTFASLTLLAISSLLLALHTRNYIILAVHVLLLFVCIEVRHIALFYPFFTCIVLFFSAFRNVAKLIAVFVILFSFKALRDMHIDYNAKKYGVPVYSAFSGWTHANNALYALKRIKLDAKYIDNPDIRNMHSFISTYLDTSKSFVVQQVGSGYLWDDKSPLNILRNRLIDSSHVDYNTSWYKLANYYHYYGTYIQKNFPYEYVMSYMYPNIKTLLKPQYGEMSDFYITPYISPMALKHYGLEAEDVKCKEDVYPQYINIHLLYWYNKLLKTSIAFILLFVVFLWRKFTKTDNILIGTIAFFLFCFYGLTLYSSWFMYRYLMPAFPLMFSLIVVIGWKMIVHHKTVFTFEWLKK